jgi:hypothetical protein
MGSYGLGLGKMGQWPILRMFGGRMGNLPILQDQAALAISAISVWNAWAIHGISA